MFNILPNFKKAIKENGYTSAEKFADEYDKRYPHYKEDSVCSSSSKFRKLESGIGNPSMETVIQISETLGCDVDYLLGRMEEPTHEDEFIHEHTGLSESSIQNIKALSKEEMSALNLLLESPQFYRYFLWELYYYENTKNNIDGSENTIEDIRSCKLDLYERSVRILDQIDGKTKRNLKSK